MQTLNPQDLVFVSVVGVNGTTRKTKTVSQFFNGVGSPVDQNGQPTSATNGSLAGLAKLNAAPLPTFDAVAYQALIKGGNASAAKSMLQGHLAAVEDAQADGSIESGLLDSVYTWLCQFHGFRADDGDWFVLKREDLDIVVDTLPSQADRKLYTVSAQAVFGA